MQQNTLGDFAQETARIVHEQGDRLKGVEKDLEHMTRDRQRCNEFHTRALEELGKLARATADAFEAHTVEHRVEAATLDRGSRNFVAVVAAIAAVVGATLPRLLEFLAGLLGLGG